MAMERAKQIQSILSKEHPSFIKVMQRSHVAHPFYMLSLEFCQKHLPKTNEIVVLEADRGQLYNVRFIGSDQACSGGWRRFSIDEKLLENDILVFHLVESCKFKVYIVRASEFALVDKAPVAVEVDGCETIKEEKKGTFEREKKCLKISPAMERAKEIQATLSAEHPSFIKVMQRSHVSKPFYMNPSLQFCQKYLPNTDEILVFEAESGKSYNVKLLGLKQAFSGGWKGFAKAEKLVENDVLVFHLVGHCKFMVYIVRASDFAPADKAPGFVKSDACATETEVEKKRTFESDEKHLRFVPVEIPTKNVEASNSSLNKSIPPNNSQSPNMEGSNPKSSEKMRKYPDKRWNQMKASSPEAMERARGIQANLSPEHPSFIKLILKSHLSNPFRMCLPFQFSKKYLPWSEKIFAFEVDNGHSYDVKFLCTKQAFGAGWKSFSQGEKLLENDMLVFHLIEPCKFKVYIVRGNELAQVDKATKVVKTEDCETEKTIVRERASERENKRLKFVPVDLIQVNLEVRNPSIKNSIHPNIINSPEVESFQPSQAIPEFNDFKIVVNGTTIEFPETVQVDYYKLCCSQKSYLHRHLIKDINRELATSIISKTVSISNAIKNSKLSTTQEDIASWCKILDDFEVFGMDVGFLKARLNRLSGLITDSKRYKEAEIELARVEKEISELEKVKRRLGDEIEGKKKVADKFEVIYEEEASAPWRLTLD